MAYGLRRSAFDQSAYAFWTSRYDTANLRDFGAVGDGVHDDTVAVQSAFNAGKPIVVIPPGLYLVQWCQISASNITVIGQPGAHFRHITCHYAPAGSFSFVRFVGVTFSSPEGQVFFGGPAGTETHDLTFAYCTIQDCAAQFLQGVGPNIAFYRCRFTQSDTPPAVLNQAIGGVSENFYVVECDFNYAASTSHSGVIVTVATNYGGITGNVWIVRNRFLTDNLPGYTIDAAIDMEPDQANPIQNVVIRDNIIYNANVYLSGADRVLVVGNTLRQTALTDTTRGIGFILYNSSANPPPGGTIVLRDNTVVQDADASATANGTPIYVDNQSNFEYVRIQNNRLVLNGLGNGFVPIISQVSPKVLEISDNIITQAAPFPNNPAIVITVLSTPPNAVHIDRNVLIGQWQHLVVAGPPGGTGSVTLPVLSVGDNDLTQFSTSTGGMFGFNPSLTITQFLAERNEGYNPVGQITPPANPLVSGTVYQNTAGVTMTIYQPAYAATSGTAGTVAVALGPTSTPPTIFTKQIPGTTSSTAPDMVEVRVPAGWYYSFTASGATLATANIIGE